MSVQESGEAREPFNQPSLEQIAYEAYYKSCQEDQPEWETLEAQVQAHWHAVVQAVNRALMNQQTGGV